MAAAGDRRARVKRSARCARAALGVALVATLVGLSTPAAGADERYRDRVFSSGQVAARASDSWPNRSATAAAACGDR